MKQRNIENPLDRFKSTKIKLVIPPGKKGKIIKYNWIQRLAIKIFRL